MSPSANYDTVHFNEYRGTMSMVVGIDHSMPHSPSLKHTHRHAHIRECGSTLYVGMVVVCKT